jgi:hypothetical protein
MDLAVNGEVIARAFDIVRAARGTGKSCEKTFRGIVPDAGGHILIEALAPKGGALLQAIEIATEDRDRVRIHCGSETPFLDWIGEEWGCDRWFEGGEPIRGEGRVTQVQPTLYDQALYRTGRAGRRFSYAIPVGPGLHSVRLMFAELWASEPGRRPMNVRVNEIPERESYDVWTTAQASHMACDLRFDGIRPVAGRILIEVEAAGEEPAILQGIEID